MAVKLRLTVRHARLDGRDFRIIQPRVTPPHATLRDADGSFLLRLDRATAWQFAAFWELAARSPRSIVHLPIRANALAFDSGWQQDMAPLDLLLVHHRVQLRPSAWPRIRARLDTGRPHTADLANVSLRDRDEPWDPRLAHRANRDRFVHHVYARTLMLTASTPVFANVVGCFTRVADHPDAHTPSQAYCSEFDVVDRPRWPCDVTELFIGHTEAWPA